MDSGTFLLSVFGALVFGTIIVCGYTYLLHRLGYWMAQRDSESSPRWLGVLLLAVAWIPVSFFGFLLPIDPFMKAACALSLYLVHAQPCCLGYWGGRLARQIEHERRWRKNIDDWLGEWECEPSKLSRDEPNWN